MIPAPTADSYVSGYRLMWVIVLFDLPVVDPEERRQATRFRKFLLDLGYGMAQYSVYMKILSGKEAAETSIARIERNIPNSGTVQILTITDKQYENLRTFRSRTPSQSKNPDQLLLL